MIENRPMSRVREVMLYRKAKPQFAELWDSLIEQYREDLEQIAKTVDVPVPSSGDVLKQITEQLKTACEAKFEEIDRKYERRLLALAQPK
jgi:hypothetical protein